MFLAFEYRFRPLVAATGVAGAAICAAGRHSTTRARGGSLPSQFQVIRLTNPVRTRTFPSLNTG